ncbi:hypothetical protein STTU_4137 [Streptomyces sp. Tu6071]|nr:hypothetical protein STTU_4137 [Streptomyces sp. Tu6071]
MGAAVEPLTGFAGREEDEGGGRGGAAFAWRVDAGTAGGSVAGS